MDEESTTEQAQVLCGKCRVVIQGPSEPTDDSIFSCPECGASDTHANVLKEAGDYFRDSAARSLQTQMKEMARHSKMMTYKGDEIPDREYKFILDII